MIIIQNSKPCDLEIMTFPIANTVRKFGKTLPKNANIDDGKQLLIVYFI
jgi:hypothetical protein